MTSARLQAFNHPPKPAGKLERQHGRTRSGRPSVSLRRAQPSQCEAPIHPLHPLYPHRRRRWNLRTARCRRTTASARRIHKGPSVPEMAGSSAWAPQGHRQGCGRIHRQTTEPVPRLAAWPSQRWRCNTLVEKNGTGKASGSIIWREEDLLWCNRGGGVKAPVYKPVRLRASELRRRRSGCLPQHTKRRWCGSGNSCVRMSISSSTNTQKSERCVVK